MTYNEREEMQSALISFALLITLGLTFWGCNAHSNHTKRLERERKEAKEYERKAEFQKEVTERKKAAYKAYGECMKGAKGNGLETLSHRSDCSSLLHQIEWSP